MVRMVGSKSNSLVGILKTFNFMTEEVFKYC